MQIDIVEYRDSWPGEFLKAAAPIRGALGDAALAIHHIGSTSVPGLAAKDVIDIQVAVADLGGSVIEPMEAAGFKLHEHLTDDHRPPGAAILPAELAKNLFTERAGERRTNIHVRVEGAFNERYAVLFRDYLIAHDAARDAYGQLKMALAGRLPDDVEFYYDVKDPAIDMLMAGANGWAEALGWEVPPTDA